MRPPIMLVQIQAAVIDEQRHRGELARHARHRSLVMTHPWRPPTVARTAAAVMRVIRRDRHSLTAYPCRLPDGRIGRTAVVLQDGEWTLICRVG